MAGHIYTYPGAADEHQWADGELRLACKRTHLSVVTYSTYVLTAAECGLQPGGWLDQAVDANPAFLHANECRVAMSIIRDVSAKPLTRRILNSPLEGLSEQDVIQALSEIEAIAKSRNIMSSRDYFRITSRFLRRPAIPISNGTFVFDVDYTCSIPTHRRLTANNTLSDYRLTDESDPELCAPAFAIKSDSLTDLHEKQIAHFAGRIKLLEEKCSDILDLHEDLVLGIRATRKLEEWKYIPLKDQIRLECAHHDTRRNADLPMTLRLQWAIHLLDTKELFRAGNFFPIMDIALIQEFDDLAWRQENYHIYYSLLLSEYYLSRMVVLAAYVILLCSTGWNGSTLASLTPQRILRTPSGYVLTGFKGRTNQYEHKSIEHAKDTLSPLPSVHDPDAEIENEQAIRAVDMLLAHHANIHKYGVAKSDSVFVSMNIRKHGKMLFSLFLSAEDLADFCDFINYPRFCADDVRAQVHNTNFLRSGRNLPLTKAKLNHKYLATTARYVDGTSLRLSHEAIMKDYGEILSKSWEYHTGRLVFGHPPQSRDERLIHSLLLFPPSPHHPTEADNIADKWLASDGQLPFEIGTEELKMCVYQRRYYQTNTTKLIRANEDAFRRFHLPRILFCEALYQVIKSSPLGGMLTSLEEKFNGTTN